LKNYMTPACHKRLSSEYDQLRNADRPEILKVIQWAAGNGDRSENADYIYGKKRLREIDSRLRFLGKRLDNAVVVDPTKVISEQIKFGATVKVLVNDEKEITYSIVGKDEIDLEKNHISWMSPIGRGLMGKEEGDVVEVKTPSGLKDIEIIKISFIAIEA